MKITGLNGKSGTGKSYVASELAAKIEADAIIDDGLYIYGTKIVSGKSAKKEKTKIGAIKTAIFTDENHVYKVRLAIERTKPKHILIVGTSEKMIDTICERLELVKPSSYIQIEEVTTPREREIARKRRDEEGMHTIPAPTLQVRPQFSGFLIDPKRAFAKQENKTKTIVRPTYSYLGSYEISDRVIEQIVDHIVSITKGLSQLLFSTSINSSDGLYIRVIVLVERGTNVIEAAETLQKRVTQSVSHMTAFNVLGVEVQIRGYRTKIDEK